MKGSHDFPTHTAAQSADRSGWWPTIALPWQLWGVEPLPHVVLPERNLHHRLQLHWVAALGAGAELPAREGAHRGVIEARIDAVQHLDTTYCAVSVNHGVERDRAFHVVAHRVRRIGGIDLRQRYRCCQRDFIVRLL